MIAYPDFLALMASQNSYYQQCTKIKLERQVGSRYFVTAVNAGKVLLESMTGSGAVIQYSSTTVKQSESERCVSVAVG